MIFDIRGQKVRLGADLACIYGAPTKAPNEQIRRNDEQIGFLVEEPHVP